MDLLKTLLWVGITAGTAGLVYVFVVLPWRLQREATDAGFQRYLPGDDIVTDPKTGYTQAIIIKASKFEVWRWLVQIGYRRAGWYSYDFLHRLMGISGCVDDERRSAKRIIPELQDLGVGDVIEIAPGMGYSVAGLEPEKALIMQSILDTAKWESVSDKEPLPEKYLRSSWVWVLEEIDEKTTRLIVRVRSDYNPGPLSTLSARIPNEFGRLLMQPRTLLVLRQRAETGTQGTPKQIDHPST